MELFAFRYVKHLHRVPFLYSPLFSAGSVFLCSIPRAAIRILCE